MNRPRYVWLAFLLAAATLVAAMGWLTTHALRVDRERSVARADAELEQRVSLALWRMDTKLAPLIAEEVARPPAHYDSFIAVAPPPGQQAGPAQAPSPLLNYAPSNVLLNFDASLDGQWKSPQAPPPELVDLANRFGCSTATIESNRARLDKLAERIDVPALVAQLPAEPLPQWNVTQSAPHAAGAANAAAGAANAAAAPTAEQQAPEADPFGDDLFGGGEGADHDWRLNAPPPQQQAFVENTAPLDPDSLAPNPFDPPAGPQQREAPPVGKAAKAAVDFTERTGRLQQAAQQELSKSRGLGNYIVPASDGAAPVVENVSRPLWVEGELLLARRVERDGRTYVQGSWLDWPRLKADLLAETADLLPQADLVPIVSPASSNPTRRLAGLPVELVVADAAATLPEFAGVDAPLQWALGFGWLALLAALAAVAGLLWGVLALSERRAAFVSSVTHELRTPLTTFRMYAEMLARDMVPSPERRREYLDTLKTEAERLTHLVENVLSYARLERGRRPQPTERTAPAELVERIAPRLAERAAAADMQLQCTVDEDAAAASLVTDVGVVEQILFNLVDNAAKYAARAADRRILLDVTREGPCIAFRIADHGPGFANPAAAARSAPFSKSAQEAADTAPGVGLGLALCRRLAKELGGRIEIAPPSAASPGAAVVLALPTRPNM